MFVLRRGFCIRSRKRIFLFALRKDIASVKRLLFWFRNMIVCLILGYFVYMFCTYFVLVFKKKKFSLRSKEMSLCRFITNLPSSSEKVDLILLEGEFMH